MTSNQQRLEELRQQAKNLAQQIEQLEDQLNHAHPTTGLLGRWAKHPQHGNVLISDNQANDDGLICVRFHKNNKRHGVMGDIVHIDDLTFPEQTSSPQDVPVGEAWLVDVHNGFDTQPHTPALKITPDLWVTPTRETADESEWHNYEITLITPLIPDRPHDTPETVTTVEEYEALPEGSVVAKPSGSLWTRGAYKWVYGDDSITSAGLMGVTRHVLRYGWGE